MKQYIFRNIPTRYYVCENGDVYSMKKSGLKKMHPTKTSNGYLKVRISINGKAYNRTIHRMVAETYIPNPNNKLEVNHIDGNKRNNDVSNLEWSTRKENADHAYLHGLFGFGENFGSTDITNKQCEKICKLLATTDKSVNEIASKVKCSRKVVDDILHRRTWNHISKSYDFTNRKLFKTINADTAYLICKDLISGKIDDESIAKKYGCTIYTVRDIRNRKSWRKISKNFKF